jgi:hypothetical protein
MIVGELMLRLVGGGSVGKLGWWGWGGGLG